MNLPEEVVMTTTSSKAMASCGSNIENTSKLYWVIRSRQNHGGQTCVINTVLALSGRMSDAQKKM